MKIPRLLAISDPASRPGPAWRRWCSELEAAGVDGLQVRCKSASDRDLLALATEARPQAKTARTLLVNARFDIALAADADGVHAVDRHDAGLLDDGTRPEDRGLREEHDGRVEQRTARSGVRDREGAAGEIIGLELVVTRAGREVGDLRGDLRERL